jgi:hypothetical protein
VAGLLKKNKVDHIRGKGRIAGKGKVIVTAADGSESEIAAKNIVIATGSEVTPLPGVEIDGERIVTSDQGHRALGSAEKAGADRRRRHRAGAGLGLAPSGLGGHGRGIHGPGPAGHGRRSVQAGQAPV